VPFTQDREDYRAALIAATIANSVRMVMASLAGKKKYEPVSIETFIRDYFGERKPVTKDPLQRNVYASLKAKLAEAKGQTDDADTA